MRLVCVQLYNAAVRCCRHVLADNPVVGIGIFVTQFVNLGREHRPGHPNLSLNVVVDGRHRDKGWRYGVGLRELDILGRLKPGILVQPYCATTGTGALHVPAELHGLAQYLLRQYPHGRELEGYSVGVAGNMNGLHGPGV